jgi:hypothetical protein
VADGYGLNPLGAVVNPCPKKDEKPDHWVEFELVSEDGEPVSWEEYRVVLPGQPNAVTGMLDGYGWTRLDGIADAGACTVHFQNLDRAVCKYLESTTARSEPPDRKGRGRNKGLVKGPVEHTTVVEPGQCCSSIAYTEGHSWTTIWTAPQNEFLRMDGRYDANCLAQGESIYIPAIWEFTRQCDTDLRHRFCLRGSTKLTVRIVYADFRPRIGVQCRLVAEGKESVETTGPDGKVTFSIHPLTMEGVLTVPGDALVREQVFILKCGTLEPHNSLQGIQQRLRNLGASDLRVDGVDDAKTKDAVRVWQSMQDIPHDEITLRKVSDSLCNQHES